MTVQLKNIITYAIALTVGSILFWLAIKDFDFPKMINDIRQANFSWIAITIIISLFSHLARAARWNILLKPLGYAPKITNTFLAVMIGYFANAIVPRLGEVSRCAVLNKLENVHFNSAFGTVVAERVFDFLCLISLICLSFALEYHRFNDFFFNKLLPLLPKNNNNTIYILAGIFIVLAVSFFLLRKRIFNSSLYTKIKQFILGLMEGALSIRKLSNKDRAVFLLHTFLIWFGYYLTTYLMFFSLPYTSGLDGLAGLVVLIVASIGMSAPVQGGIGTFEVCVISALTFFYNLTKDESTTYALVIHASQFLTVLVLGGLCAVIVLFHKRKEGPVPQNA